MKQVHAARFKDGGLLGDQQQLERSEHQARGEEKQETQKKRVMHKEKAASTGEESPPVAVAVLRRNVEDEALASLTALEASAELAPVAPRLGQLVYGEFNLFEEGEALKEFATTTIGQSSSCTMRF